MVAKKERQPLSVDRETLGKYFYDLSKLVFGGMVLGGISVMRNEALSLSNITYFILGIITTVILARIGRKTLKQR